MSAETLGAMQTCSCGIPVKDGEPLCPRCAALRTLELPLDAGEDQIRAAYHVMVKVWHPDRFQSDARLRAAAEAKLKAVNTAYTLLTSSTSAKDTWRGANAAPRSSSAQRPPQAEGFTANRPARRKAATPPPHGFTSAQIRFGLKIAFQCLLVLIALVVCRYLWIAFDVRDSTSEAAAKVMDIGKDSLGGVLAGPKRRFLHAIEQDMERLGLSKPAPAPAVILQTGAGAAAGPSRSGLDSSGKSHRPTTGMKAAPLKVYSYITVGSTRDEVLDQVGTPTEATDNKLVYGKSELYLKNNSVVGWRIDPVASPIRVKLWPQSSVDPTLDSFTVGSTKDLVLVVQGTPTAFSDDKFEYGGSHVYFRDGRVASWKSDPDSIPLKAR